MNQVSAVRFSSGVLSPRRAVTLEVRTGSGRVISFPVVVAEHDGVCYPVSMLGEDAD